MYSKQYNYSTKLQYSNRGMNATRSDGPTVGTLAPPSSCLCAMDVTLSFPYPVNRAILWHSCWVQLLGRVHGSKSARQSMPLAPALAKFLFLYFLSVCPVAQSQICCKAMIKSCLACTEGITVAAYCEKHPGEYDCPKNTTNPVFCCEAMSKSCLACSAGLSVEEYCTQNPGKYGCPSNTTNPTACCEAMTKSCLACSEGVSIEEYCKLHSNEYDCGLTSAASRPTESLRTKSVLFALQTLLFFARVWM